MTEAAISSPLNTLSPGDENLCAEVKEIWLSGRFQYGYPGSYFVSTYNCSNRCAYFYIDHFFPGPFHYRTLARRHSSSGAATRIEADPGEIEGLKRVKPFQLPASLMPLRVLLSEPLLWSAQSYITAVIEVMAEP
jgi:hypothetical protein